ncbi:MAG: LysM peptidoglycan-binding domain-containing protein [Planctomycetota bacterium]|nr:LysM peptidoglycan-binding domain-containing protein [Planctomycetota bacterium]
MADSSPRIAVGMLGLVALWIFVYWWWPASAEPKGISFSSGTRIEQPAVMPPAPKPPVIPAEMPKPSDVKVRPPEVQPREAQAESGGTAPAIIPPEFIEHTLAPGETYATLSLRYYGTSAYANSISKANPLMSPTSLRPGRVVRVPKDPKNIQGLPAKPVKTAESRGPSTMYTVQEGDTLSTIASSVYGESKYSKLIFEANRSVLKNEHSLRIGQKLTIPAKPKQ